MSALGGGLNRSTQHSMSFYLLGFEPQGLARTVPGFSAAVKPRKNSRRFVTHSVFPLQDRECCVDRLNRPPIADILSELPADPSAHERLHFFHRDPVVFVLIHASENALVRGLKLLQ